MTPETLLPCPFCGHKEIDPAEWMSEDGSGPGCPECGALADSVEKWNMRALLSPPKVPEGLDIPYIRSFLQDLMLHVRGKCAYVYEEGLEHTIKSLIQLETNHAARPLCLCGRALEEHTPDKDIGCTGFRPV